MTLKEGSERGRVVFKERLLQYMSLVPESVLTSLLVGYISQIFFHGQEMIRRKLDYIKLPELDLDRRQNSSQTMFLGCRMIVVVR